MPSFPSFEILRLSAAALACGVMLAAAPPAAAQASVPPLSLDAATWLALGRSGALAAARAEADAARAMALAASRRPDPVLKLGLNNLPLDGPDRGSLTRDFMTMRTLGLMQEFTSTDKLQARAARAAAQGRIALAAGRQAGAELQRDAALAWLERSFQQSQHELLQAQLTETERQVFATEAAYRGGRGPQADVFAARAELEALRDRVAQTERAIAVATTQLGRWIGPAASQPLAARPAFVRPAWADAGLEHRWAAGHPVVDVAVQQEALAAADVALARANRHPDWSAELMFAQRGSAYSNMVSVNLALPLPWDRTQRQDRELAAAHALAERARFEREEREREQQAQVQALLQEWRSHDERLARHDARILPLAEQRRDAALGAYRGGTAGLGAVLEARRAAIDARAERLRIEQDIARAWAQLNFLVAPDDFGAVATPAPKPTPMPTPSPAPMPTPTSARSLP